MTKRLLVFGTAVMTTVLALVVLWQFRTVVVYVLVSLALAATVRPLIKAGAMRSSRMRLALILLYLVSFGGFGYVILLSGRLAIGDIQQFTQTLSVQDTWRLPPWLQGTSFDQALVARLPPPSTLFEAVTGDRGQFVLPAILGFTQGIGGVVSSGLVMLLLSIYWSMNQIHFERLWLSLLPSELRKQARSIWRTVELDLGAYIRSEVVQSFLAGLLFGLGFWLLGSPYPTLLALIGALVLLIPIVGAILAVGLPLLFGLLTSVQLSLFTVFYTLMVVVVLRAWIKPRLYTRKWDNPILTLVILLVLADVFGIVGIVVAPPLSVVCQILWSLLVSNRLASGAATHVSDLKERQARLQVAIGEMDELPPPLVINSMERLNHLLEKAEPVLLAALPAEPSDLFHPPQPFSGNNAPTSQNSEKTEYDRTQNNG